VEKLVLVSAVFDPDGLLFKPSSGGELPEQILDAYGEVSPDGRDHLHVVVRKIVDAVATEASPTASELLGVPCPTLVLAGDDDLVTLEHTIAMYRALPQAQLAVVPNASHLLLVEHPGLIRDVVATFLGTQPSPTLMPIRRAHPAQHA
jgi:pimeloyl-ACP methyl ester carboxylesterase